MKRKAVMAVLGVLLLQGAAVAHAEEWIKNALDVPNKNLEANYYDGDSVKVQDGTLKWTEKYVLTPFGEKYYTKHLSQFDGCRAGIEKHGNVTHHQIDFEIKQGKWRMVAKRNYSKDNKLVCTDKDMGNELDTEWYKIINKSPMSERFYILSTKYKLPDLF